MNLSDVKEFALARMPVVDCEPVPGSYRHNVIDSLEGSENIGIELGVAAGVFSERMVRSGKFKLFFGVDIYGDRPEEYGQALRRVGMLEPYKLLRMTFDEAVDLFGDGSLDFVYVDGYAHTGEEGGKTFLDWYPKLKLGGIMAGDDYSDEWPLVKWSVNSFVKRLDTQLYVTDLVETESYCKYPSWFIRKDRESVNLENLLPAELIKIGASERRRVQRKRDYKRFKRAIRSRVNGAVEAMVSYFR